jgi:predicted metalloprotease with PDZ domain
VKAATEAVVRGGRIGVLLALLAGVCGAALAEEVLYRLTYPGSTADRVAISLELPGGTAAGAFLMPRAVPMGYSEQPWAAFVSRVSAEGLDGEPIEVERGEGPRWNLIGAPVARLGYEVDLGAMERSILEASDSSKVRPDYVGLLGYSVFGYLEGLEDRSVRLEIEGPEGWPLFTTLAPKVEPDEDLTGATAPDFYALADTQVLMGPALEVLRVGDEPPLFVAGYAEAPWDIELSARLGREALDALIDYFGEAPFSHFSMVAEILQPLSTEHEYGFSMEHLDSATFFLGPQNALTERSSPEQRRRVLYNYAHHIAHAWIPKRCAGPGYFPFDWEFAPVLDTIWFSEGFGQYAAGVALAERLERGEEFLERLLDWRFRRPLGEAPSSIRRMSTVELSRVASTRYGTDFRLGRNIFSRGAMMAAEMDAHIREQTGGTKSLKDVLRHLFAWAQQHGPTVPEDELLRLLNEGSGVDLGEIHARWMAPQPKADG